MFVFVTNTSNYRVCTFAGKNDRFHLPVCLSVCLSMCLYVCLSLCLFADLPLCASISHSRVEICLYTRAIVCESYYSAFTRKSIISAHAVGLSQGLFQCESLLQYVSISVLCRCMHICVHNCISLCVYLFADASISVYVPLCFRR